MFNIFAFPNTTATCHVKEVFSTFAPKPVNTLCSQALGQKLKTLLGKTRQRSLQTLSCCRMVGEASVAASITAPAACQAEAMTHAHSHTHTKRKNTHTHKQTNQQRNKETKKQRNKETKKQRNQPTNKQTTQHNTRHTHTEPHN